MSACSVLAPAGRLGHPMGVERVAQLDALEVEVESDLGPHLGQPGMTGRDLLGPHAVLATERLLHRDVTAGRRRRVELERAVHHGDVVRVLELLQRDIEPGEAEGTPRAGEIGPDLDLHAPPAYGSLSRPRPPRTSPRPRS